MQGVVGGPADQPPTQPADEPGYIEDWKRRAKEALKQAYGDLESGAAAAKQRATDIANRVKEGVAAIQEANPLEAARQKIDDLRKASNALQGGLFGLGLVGTAVLVWLAYELFLKRR